MSDPGQEHRLMLQFSLIKSYSDRMKSIVNQGTFPVHWWAYQVGVLKQGGRSQLHASEAI